MSNPPGASDVVRLAVELERGSKSEPSFVQPVETRNLLFLSLSSPSFITLSEEAFRLRDINAVSCHLEI